MAAKEMESTIQMRLYTLTKRQFVMVFVAFFVAFFVTLIIGIAGPAIIVSHEKSAVHQLQVPPSQLMAGKFQINTGLMSTFSQQLWLLSRFKINGTKKDLIFSTQFNLKVEVRGQGKDTSFHLYSASDNKTRQVTCRNGECSHTVILHLGYLDYPSYAIKVTFDGLQFPKGIRLADVIFSLKHYSNDFSQVEIWFRFVFLVMAFMVTCMFAHSLRKFSVKDWSIEQKWMSLLLPLLLLYNDPIFPLNFLVNSWVPGMFDSLFQASFLCALLLFWLCAFHGIRLNDRRFLSFYLPKLMIVGLLWVSAFVLSSWQQYNELRDPTYQYKLDIGHFMGLKVFFFSIGAVYLIYLIYLLIRAYSELKAMPYFDIRLKFLTALMLIVLTISLVITGLRFGTAVLQDNFIAEIETHYKNSAEFLSFYGLLNFYLYCMAFVYSPAKNALYDSYIREPSTFSMLNESDEESGLIYSKKEGTRSPYSSSDED
ncbi:transmembrane protein 181-like [Nematostella vectensis]|uniref:transmembrane protein 181-like n=1 Tax=Nematostella vectensis TaxID=45351 RepID=UPI00207736A5|nr:transmembrane protein 181-like [Nematostella vectensis]